MRVSPRVSAGFSLLEVLVAFSILALSVSVLLGVYSGGLRNTSRSIEYAEAAVVAESAMARVGADIPLEPGTHNSPDEESGSPYSWRVEVAEYEGGDDAAMPAGAALLRVRVIVQWGDGARRFELESLRGVEG